MLLLATFFVLFCVYLVLLVGRRGHKKLPLLKEWYYAHRGLHKEGLPENSLGAFAAAREAGYGIELDIHLMKDGNLAVIHDASLLRTAGADVIIEDLTAEDLDKYFLEGTDEKIPLFSEVLSLIDGSVPLIVELKSQSNNYVSLCETACRMLSDYNGLYCMESFDPRCVLWLKRNRNDVIRGQLAYNLFRVRSSVSPIMKFFLRYNLMNIVTKPDFIAYGFTDRKTLSNFLCRKLWGIQCVTWTIRNQEDFDTAVQEGWIPIFENIMP